MIYIEPPYLLPEKTAPERASETPLLKTWLAQLPQVFKSSRDEIAKLINTYLVPCTELLRLELDQPVSPLYLPYISPISLLYLPYISRAAPARARSAGGVHPA